MNYFNIAIDINLEFNYLAKRWVVVSGKSESGLLDMKSESE